MELGRGGKTAAQLCDGCAEGVGGGDVLEVLVGLYGEGGGVGDGEGRRQPGSVGVGLSGCDEGLDGLECRQGGCGGGGGSVPLGDQGEELVEVEAECGLVEVGAGVPGALGGEYQAGGGCGDREVLYGPGGQVAVVAHGHNAHGRVVGVGLGDGGEAVEQGQCVLGGRGQPGRVSPSLTAAVRAAAVVGDGGEAGTRVVERWGEGGRGRGRGRGRGHWGLLGVRPPAGARGGRLR